MSINDNLRSQEHAYRPRLRDRDRRGLCAVL
jgi:hypothetical protein